MVGALVVAVKIGSNISSLQAQRRLSEASSTLSKTYERLSSGQRINRASDDAAGLSIADSLGAGRRVFTQGVRNLNDGISALQIADGAVSNLSQIVTRIRELAEQAANGSYSSNQRKAMDDEAMELEKEYFRISRSASFNGTNLFDGSLSDGLRLQAGYGADGSIQSTLGKGLGTGTFGSGVTCTTDTGSVMGASNAVACGDVNGDGILDLVTAGYSYDGSTYQGQVSVLLGRGDGTFGSSVTYAAEAGSETSMSFAVTLGDANGDGILDLVTAGYSNDGGPTQGQASVFLGRGDGTFGSKVAYVTETGGTWSASHAVTLGDVNGDGILDLVTAGSADYQGQASVLLGLGDGTFGSKITYTTETGSNGGTSYAVALSDVNEDGNLDLVTAGVVFSPGQQGQASVLLGRGDGTFGVSVTYATETGGNGSGSFAVTLGDINGDGILDLVTAGSVFSGHDQGQASVRLGQGDGTFGSRVTYATETGSGSSRSVDVTLGDVNGDGMLDLVTAGFTENGMRQGQASVLLGRRDGSFGSKLTYSTDTGSLGGSNHAVTLGDLNGDGIIDLVTAGGDDNQGQASVLLGFSREGIAPLLPFSLATQADALQAMAPLDRKLSQLASQRGVIGAFQSRLSVAINTLQSASENYASAESRIRDTDVASDAAELTRLQISQHAATAILAQANQAPDLAIQLIRGGQPGA